jgi:hypothetical protein
MCTTECGAKLDLDTRNVKTQDFFQPHSVGLPQTRIKMKASVLELTQIEIGDTAGMRTAHRGMPAVTFTLDTKLFLSQRQKLFRNFSCESEGQLTSICHYTPRASF